MRPAPKQPGAPARRKRARTCIADRGSRTWLSSSTVASVSREIVWIGLESDPQAVLQLESVTARSAQPLPPAVCAAALLAGVLCVVQGQAISSEALCQRLHWRRFCFALRMGPDGSRAFPVWLSSSECSAVGGWPGLTERVRLTPMGRERWVGRLAW